MKTSIIKTCLFQREWAGQNGTIYYHSIILENGDYGTIGSKEKNPEKLMPGKELTYEILPDGEWNGQAKYKIKAVSPSQQSGGGGYAKGGSQKSSPASLRTMCLAYAKDLWVAGKLLNEADTLATAEKFFEWVNKES